MIISRTPLRISFFGEGTDHPSWYLDHPGAVLATTIDKYCYMTARRLPPFFKYRSRILYSKVEHVDSVDGIRHPVVREALRFLGIHEGVELHHDADLPARTGLGSSSTFTVGLLHVLHGLRERLVGKTQLVREAFHLEHDVLRENVGAQDRTLAAFGGFNRIDFSGKESIRVTPLALPAKRLASLQDHLMLYFTGFSRTASKIARDQVKRTSRNEVELLSMYAMVRDGSRILSSGGDVGEFGKLLHEAWRLKRGLSPLVSTPAIDAIYNDARAAGAIGGGLLGSGGGGFMLLFVRPEHRARVVRRLSMLLHVPFRFEGLGTQIIYYEPDGACPPIAGGAGTRAKHIRLK